MKKHSLGSICRMYFGPPGMGKTTLAARLAVKYLRKGIIVYSNFPCKGCLRLDSLDIGNYELRDCICIIDEAGIDFNNRDWKKFSKEATSYVKLHRHYNTGFIFLSQGWDDCDKKIRTICSEYFYLSKLGPFTLIRQMKKRVGVDDITKQIIDEYFKLGLLFGGLSIFFRPLYYKYFDSWSAPVLPSYKREPWA